METKKNSRQNFKPEQHEHTIQNEQKKELIRSIFCTSFLLIYYWYIVVVVLNIIGVVVGFSE